MAPLHNGDAPATRHLWLPLLVTLSHFTVIVKTERPTQTDNDKGEGQGSAPPGDARWLLSNRRHDDNDHDVSLVVKPAGTSLVQTGFTGFPFGKSKAQMEAEEEAFDFKQEEILEQHRMMDDEDDEARDERRAQRDEEVKEEREETDEMTERRRAHMKKFYAELQKAQDERSGKVDKRMKGEDKKSLAKKKEREKKRKRAEELGEDYDDDEEDEDDENPSEKKKKKKREKKWHQSGWWPWNWFSSKDDDGDEEDDWDKDLDAKINEWESQQGGSKFSKKNKKKGYPDGYPKHSAVKVTLPQRAQVTSYDKATKQYTVKLLPATSKPEIVPQDKVQLINEYKPPDEGEKNLDYSHMFDYSDKQSAKLENITDQLLHDQKRHKGKVDEAVKRHNNYVTALWDQNDIARSLKSQVENFREDVAKDDELLKADLDHAVLSGKQEADKMTRIGHTWHTYMQERMKTMSEKHEEQDEKLREKLEKLRDEENPEDQPDKERRAQVLEEMAQPVSDYYKTYGSQSEEVEVPEERSVHLQETRDSLQHQHQHRGLQERGSVSLGLESQHEALGLNSSPSLSLGSSASLGGQSSVNLGESSEFGSGDRLSVRSSMGDNGLLGSIS